MVRPLYNPTSVVPLTQFLANEGDVMIISAIPAFDDNYIWAIQPAEDNAVIVVDPGDATPVFEWLAHHQKQLIGILITHHHWDHTNGILPLVEAFAVPVYGPHSGHIEGISHPVAAGDTFTVPGSQCEFQVLATPGHTLDHLSYHTPGHVFVGDTLFSAGCGRMFEGTPEQFFHSLQLLAELPDTTNVYSAHEYTLANLTFALAAEPENQKISDYATAVRQKRAQGEITLPSSIALEKEINPFLRATSIQQFAELRRWKDQF
ncbi:hydroxyacylglutathione hydrolase [Pseudidiomarina indica]|uniref:Hydroxyacylglutathione hydrolase n=2 Tax=Pseudidiomarina indica TaxID=1159017 RepID=A0A1G6AXN4_9GAMM|nr:hydroxyacylglutathione hydrolase [Pseudidiomarina indica]